jgi:hypothetical protein
VVASGGDDLVADEVSHRIQVEFPNGIVRHGATPYPRYCPEPQDNEAFNFTSTGWHTWQELSFLTEKRQSIR